jgi:hypothetical protein
MTEGFRYSDQEWSVVAKCLEPLTGDDWRVHIEFLIDLYLVGAEGTDPRVPKAAAAKACWSTIGKHARELQAALAALPPYHISHDELLAWQQTVAAMVDQAASAGEEFKKSKDGFKRSRGDNVVWLITKLLEFWTKRGGHVGKNLRSLSTKFVIAAAAKVIGDTVPDVRLPRAVTYIARLHQ